MKLNELVGQMTLTQAKFIRILRVDESYTWCQVADGCYVEFVDWDKTDWCPPSSEVVGMALCEKAAEFFNENYMEKPWR